MQVLRENDAVRIRAKRAGELLEEGRNRQGKYAGGKWGGLYLRAPDIYFRILEKAGDKLVRLSEVAEVRRGFTTGANDFFYLEVLPYRPKCPLCDEPHEEALTLEEERAFWLRGERPPEGALVAVRSEGGWEGYLEAESLAPVIRSPQDLPTFPLEVRPHTLSTRIFYTKKLGPHARHYVSWGERVEITLSQGKNQGKRVRGYHNLPSLSSRQPWWRLPNPAFPPNLVCMMSYNDRFGFWINWESLVDARLYTIQAKPGVSLKALAVALNSAFVFLQQGLLGRSNLGQGALDFKVYEAERLLILDPSLLTKAEEQFAQLGAFLATEEGGRGDAMAYVLGEEELEELWSSARRVHLERINLAASLRES